jgi:hypothetical protein
VGSELVQPDASVAAAAEDPDVGVSDAAASSSPALALLAELERADDHDLDTRLALLRRVESTIATSLEGLDGL